MPIIEASYSSEVVSEKTEMTSSLAEAYQVWLRLFEDEKIPEWRTDHFLAFPNHLLSSVVLAKQEPNTDDFRIVFWGSRRSHIMSRDYTNYLISSIPPKEVATKAVAELNEVITNARPMKMTTKLLSRSNGKLEYQKLRLPFSDAESNISFVLSLDDPKTFPETYFSIWSKTSEQALKARQEIP